MLDLNWVEFAWTGMAAASLTLGLIHLVVWCRARSRPAHLAFFFLATSVAAFSGIEMLAMRAQTPAEYAVVARWAHVPIAMIVLSMIGFVHFYLAAGRRWLAGAAVSLRLLTLLLNFVTGVSINFQDVAALEHVELWGSAGAAVPFGVPNPWQVVAHIANLLLVAYIVDASITLWRRGDSVARRRRRPRQDRCRSGRLFRRCRRAARQPRSAAFSISSAPPANIIGPRSKAAASSIWRPSLERRPRWTSHEGDR